MAFVSIRRYEGVDDVDEVIKRAEEGFVPIISSTPGYLGYHLIDAGGGVIVTASVFESKDSAEESNRKAADWVRKNLAPFVPNAPQITAGEERITHQK